VSDQYGNYVVQYVLELGNLYKNAMIADSLVGRVEKLSIGKFSANVVEKVKCSLLLLEHR